MTETNKKNKATKTTPCDVAEHLLTPEEMAAYLDAWLEEAPDDASGIAEALGNIAHTKKMTQFAVDGTSAFQLISSDKLDIQDIRRSITR